MSSESLTESAVNPPLYTEIQKCRLCSNNNLEQVFSLGKLHLTGVFPKEGESVPKGPLDLLHCKDCGLVQLAHNYNSDVMFGPTYGYRSGLNPSMVHHLEAIAKWSTKLVGGIKVEDVVIDIGCNDGTLLSKFPDNMFKLGFDPLVDQFADHLDTEGLFISKCFSAEEAVSKLENKKAKIVCSIAMFYDLEQPVEFAKQVASILDENGIWIVEVADFKTLFINNAYDGICHEHLEYYDLYQLDRIGQMAGLKIIDWNKNSVNGGSVLVAFAHRFSNYQPKPIDDEHFNDYNFEDFNRRVDEQTEILQARVMMLKGKDKCIMGYGASTKGNVLLQHAGIGLSLDYIAEVNRDKFGRVTPGTNIPIISEMEARRRGPDVFLVLPWHFQDFVVEKERVRGGPDLLFPLPIVEMVSLND